MKCVFQTNNSEDLNLNVFNMITGINELKIKQNMHHANVNVKLIVEKETCICENDKCVGSIVANSVITWNYGGNKR